MIHFHKYQGTGNDFIMIDDRDLKFPSDQIDIISKMCHRKFGIGSDGLILIQPHDQLDFKMVFFNPDGSKSLCGNGSRCAVAFANALGMISDETRFETTDGEHHAFIEKENIHFSLHDVSKVQPYGKDLFIDTGSPHYLKMVQDLDNIDVIKEGQDIRYSELFSPSGTNVNFIELNQDRIRVRTYERGVENETLSCGTGVTASALAANLSGMEGPIRVETRGGTLFVTFDRGNDNDFKNIYLAGPAKKVFEGDFEQSV